MSLICLGSAHGSPGVTTTAVALAGVWPEGRGLLLVEADPSGGMLAAWFGLSDTPGLVSLTAVARRGLDGKVVGRHAQQLPGGIPVLVAPPSAEQAQAALRDLADPLAEWCAGQGEVDVIADCGRLSPGPPHLGLLRRAEQVWVVARPSVDQLRPAAARAAALRAAGMEASLLLVGDTPYSPGEVESTLGVTVAGVVAWDPAAADALAGGAAGRDVRRSLLVRSAASLADGLTTEPVEVSTEVGSSPSRAMRGVGS